MNRRWFFLISITLVSCCFQGVHGASSGPGAMIKTGIDDLEDNLRLVKNLHFNTSTGVSLIVPVVNKRIRVEFGELGAGCIFDPFPKKTQLRLATIGRDGAEDTTTHEIVSAFKELFADKVHLAAGGFKEADIEGQFEGTEQKTMMQKIIDHLDNIWVSPNMIYCLKQALLHKDMMTGHYFRRTEKKEARALRYAGDQFIMMMRLLQSWNRDFKLDAKIKGIVDKFPKDVRRFLELLSEQIAGNREYLADKINAMWDIWAGTYHFTFGPDGLPTNFGVHVSAVHFGEDTAGCDMWWKLLDKGEDNPKSWDKLEKLYPRHSFLELLPLFTAKTGDADKDAVRAQRAAALQKASYEDGGRYHVGQTKSAPEFITNLNTQDIPTEDRCPTLRRYGNTIVAFMKRPTLHDSMRLAVGIVSSFMRDYLRIVAGNSPEASEYRDIVRTASDAINFEGYYFGTDLGLQVHASTVGLVARDPLRGAPDESGLDEAAKIDAAFARKKALARSRRTGIKVAATKKAILEELRRRVEAFDVDSDEHRPEAWDATISKPSSLESVVEPARVVSPPTVVAGTPAGPPSSAPPVEGAPVNLVGSSGSSQPQTATLPSDAEAIRKLGLAANGTKIAVPGAEAEYVKDEDGSLYRKYKGSWQGQVGKHWLQMNPSDKTAELDKIAAGVSA